ncbi:MAG: hypothetical protein IVW53_15445 [Chloroflexi bacterium]|nr:hypothetical protein [Chloroflexota bacterium]
MEPPALTISHGQATVAAAGTRVQLPDGPARTVSIKALHANTGIVYVGGSTVAAANGYPLNKDDAIDIAIDNLSSIWIDADTNGSAVAWMVVD